jgi:hypothetical protein
MFPPLRKPGEIGLFLLMDVFITINSCLEECRLGGHHYDYGLVRRNQLTPILILCFAPDHSTKLRHSLAAPHCGLRGVFGRSCNLTRLEIALHKHRKMKRKSTLIFRRVTAV